MDSDLDPLDLDLDLSSLDLDSYYSVPLSLLTCDILLMLLVVIGKSIRIDSPCQIDSEYQIVMKNFDSVPHLQRFSYVHHSLCCKIASWLTFTSMTPLASLTVLQDRVIAHIHVNDATRFTHCAARSRHGSHSRQ